MFKKLFYVPVSAAIILCTPTFAKDYNDMSAEEIENAFSKQLTRGLVLAPKADDGSNADYVQLAADERVSIDISFDFDSSILRDDQKLRLGSLCKIMKTLENDLFRVVGHTDASGSTGYNERLSLLRAQEVKRFLVSDCGISESRLEAVGVGEGFLLDQEDPDSSVNRRVEFQALS